ncbi:hypothetical protein BBK14_27820 [Parafrankia soli]|uniref:AMIN-like domain-containing protein n=2 Tax=Parafrankia soli TaxID=2599596 RepID=A0A1S1PIN0_9ACTN|nr:hypothetical protein [Parafrankia soli]OHV20492.1 hypothetical protein BBK14_27820 [Parafrankia soli]
MNRLTQSPPARRGVGRRRVGTLALAAGVLALGLAGCGGADDGGTAGRTASAPPVTTTAGTPSASVAARPTGSPRGGPAPTPATPSRLPTTPGEPAWSSEPRRVEHALPGTATVVAVRGAHNVAGGLEFDRLVIEFRDRVPGYDVRYVADVRSPGEGAVVPLRGQAFLELVLFPAAAHDDAGTSTLTTPRTGGGLPALVQYRLTGDYEGYVHFGLGVDDRVGFRVLELSDPARLVIDLAA